MLLREQVCMLRLLALLMVLTLSCCTLPTEDVSGRQVFTQAQIRTALSQIGSSDIALNDWRYLAYTQEELTEFLRNFEWVQDVPRLPEYRDCNAFAVYLHGNVRLFLPGIPFGVVKSSRHLANIFVDDDLSVKVIDMKKTGNVLLDVDPSVFYSRVEI